MYCIHCGAEGAATFCARCGRPQHDDKSLKTNPHGLPGEAVDREPSQRDPEGQDMLGWTRSIQYETVLASPEARRRIAAAGRGASKGVTGDDLLAIFDAVSPIGFSLEKLTHAILPIYDRLGIKTDREVHKIFNAPPGRVMLAVICALAAKALAIADVCQDATRCSFSAAIPAGLITNRGKLHVLMSVEEQGIRVSIAATISGQWYDFGKSQGLIDEMFASVQTNLTDQQLEHPEKDQRVA